MTSNERHPSSSRSSSMRAEVSVGVLTALVLAGAVKSARAGPFASAFQDIVNTTDPTFNQKLGSDSGGPIPECFGRGEAGYPSKGYSLVAAHTALTNFTNENFTGLAETRVTGLNNSAAPSSWPLLAILTVVGAISLWRRRAP